MISLKNIFENKMNFGLHRDLVHTPEVQRAKTKMHCGDLLVSEKKKQFLQFARLRGYHGCKSWFGNQGASFT